MRILIITDNFPPRKFGGMAQHAWHIARHLSQRHAVRVLIPRRQNADWGKLPFEVLPSLSIRFPALDRLAILWATRSFQPDVVHVCNAALSYSSFVRRFPTVTRTVGNDFLRAWCGYGAPLRSVLYRLPGQGIKNYVMALETRKRSTKAIARLKKVKAVVANSDWTRDRLIERGVEGKRIKVIVGGVDTAVFTAPVDRRQVRRDIGLAERGFILLTAGNLIEKKGFDTVLRALAALATRWPEVRYVIVGSGPYGSYLGNLARERGVADRVLFVGAKGQEDLCKYYQAADVYVQISREETMGRTYMEAGACGIPVVAAAVGGVPSVVKANVNGLLVQDPEDEQEVCKALDRLFGDEALRKRLGEAGRSLAQERFSWKHVSAAFEDALSAAAGDRLGLTKN